MSALLHDKTVEIAAAGTYIANPDNELIMINTTGAVVLTLPLPTPQYKKFTIEAVVTPSLTVKDAAGSTVTTYAVAKGVMTLEYVNDAWLFRKFTVA